MAFCSVTAENSPGVQRKTVLKDAVKFVSNQIKVFSIKLLKKK